MKLLVVFPSPIRGGAEEHALTVASAAAKQGWDVHAAFPRTNGTTSLIEDFTAAGVRYHPLEIANTDARELKKVGQYLPQLARTFLLILKLKPDVIEINLPYPDKGLGPILACGMLKIPTAVVFQLVPAQFSSTDKILKLYAWARARNQQWIAISENNRQLICDFFQVCPQQVKCIYNGVQINSELTNNSNYEDVTKLRTQVRQELGLPETGKLLLTVGRLSSQKGYSYLIPVIAPIVQEFPDVKFIWVGDGEQRQELEKKVKDCSVEDHVLFLGYRDDVPRLLKSADLFVFPTLYEGGQSFALTEAMAYGLPIVTSDASGIPEVIDHQVHGLIFPTGDRTQLKEAICWALTHPEQMQTMARHARDRAQDFSEEKMIQQYLEVWRNLS